MEEENWRAVVGYEGLYEVSDLGRVRSVDRVLPFKGTLALRKGRLRKSRIAHNGYVRIHLVDGVGGTKDFPVHRLVLQAFSGLAPPGRAFVNHKDFSKANNQPENLEWVSNQENVDHARSGGRLHPVMGFRKNCRHSPETIEIVRTLCTDRRLTTSEIAKKTGVPRSTVGKVRCGSSWNTPDQKFPRTHKGNTAMDFPIRAKKLTIELAREIRKMGSTGSLTQREIGRAFGISQSVAGMVLNHKSWKEGIT